MLEARSIAEVQLYLKVAGCERCGKARQFDAGLVQSITVPCDVTLSANCGACGTSAALTFRVKDAYPTPPEGYPPAINETQRCSRLIDLGQWITLVRLLVAEARAAKTKDRMRFLNLQAGMCYDEALKFYDDDDNDLPPADAFITDSSRERFRSAPHQFARSRLIGERAKLPTPHSG